MALGRRFVRDDLEQIPYAAAEHDANPLQSVEIDPRSALSHQRRNSAPIDVGKACQLRRLQLPILHEAVQI